MNLLKRLDLLRRGVEALERIARALEYQVLQSRSRKGLFSFEPGRDPKMGSVYMQSDEEFAEIEAEDQKHPDLVRQEQWLRENAPNED